jgi:opacity protein-like surface antigen
MTVLSEGGGGNKGFAGMLTTPMSQTEKGKLFLDGSSSLHLNIGSSKSKSDGEVVEGSGYSYFDFNFLPKAGYFFIPNFVGGLFMDIEAYSDKSKDASDYQQKGVTFVAGPFVRYYVPVTDQFMPYAEAQVGFGVDNSKTKYSSSDDWSKTNESVFTYRLGGGATYFFNEIVGCDLFLGYQHDSYKYKDSGDNESSDSKSIYSQFTMQLGIVVILDPSK